MNRVVTAPDIAYVVESLFPDGRTWEVFVIEQALALPKGNRQIELLGNAIDQHLHNLSMTTGFRYRVIYEGSPDRAASMVKSYNGFPL
jgi:hypothetical protein